MPKWINLNSKYLPFVIIFLGSLFFFWSDPPHSICSTEILSYKRSLKGAVYAYQDKKNIIPATITSAMATCRSGKSSGSCISYFDIINSMIINTNQVETSCLPELYADPNVMKYLKNFFLISSALAWGDEVPKESQTNWFSESNLLVFCKVKKSLKEYLPEEEYEGLVNTALSSFPYKILSFEYKEDSVEYQNNKAILKMNKQDVYNKSILSLRCERYF
ncbi:MAG: hypothetical protein KDD45_02490 [Bdellovibrionales bacterium]|nr:hypothetical protein [Bdellovibrionales bacterium]